MFGISSSMPSSALGSVLQSQGQAAALRQQQAQLEQENAARQQQMSQNWMKSMEDFNQQGLARNAQMAQEQQKNELARVLQQGQFGQETKIKGMEIAGTKDIHAADAAARLTEGDENAKKNTAYQAAEKIRASTGNMDDALRAGQASRELMAAMSGKSGLTPGQPVQAKTVSPEAAQAWLASGYTNPLGPTGQPASGDAFSLDRYLEAHAQDLAKAPAQQWGDVASSLQGKVTSKDIEDRLLRSLRLGTLARGEKVPGLSVPVNNAAGADPYQLRMDRSGPFGSRMVLALPGNQQRHFQEWAGQPGTSMNERTFGPSQDNLLKAQRDLPLLKQLYQHMNQPALPAVAPK